MRVSIRAPQAKSAAMSPTKYISERDRDESREGRQHRDLFSAEHDKLSVEEANRSLNGKDTLSRADTFHLVLSLRPEDFDKMGATDKARTAAFQEVIRKGMEEARESIKADHLRWVAGIHLNTDNPHTHVVIWKEYKNTEHRKQMTLNEMPYRWLPKSEGFGADKVVTPSPFLARLEAELDQQQAAFRERNPDYERSVGFARDVAQTMTPITDSQQPKSEYNEPLMRAERFDSEAERYESSKPKFNIAITKDLAEARGLQLLQETKLDELLRQQASLADHGERWKFRVEGELRPLSLYDIDKRINDEAFAKLRREGIKPNQETVPQAKEEMAQKYAPHKESIQSQLEAKAQQLQGQVTDYEKRVSVGRESLGEGGANVIPKLTQAQADWIKTEAVRSGRVDRLTLALAAERQENGFEEAKQQRWLHGQQLLTQARLQGNENDRHRFENGKNKEVVEGRSYASALREAQYLAHQAKYVDYNGNINLENVIPSVRYAKQERAEAAMDPVTRIGAYLERKAEGLAQTRESLAGITTFLQQQVTGEKDAVRLTLRFSEYAEITRIAVETRDIELVKEARKAEIVADRMSGDDVGRAFADHDLRMQTLVTKEERSANFALDQIEKRGERTTMVVTDKAGQEVALSLKQSLYNDTQRLFNFKPSHETKSLAEMLQHIHTLAGRDKEAVQEFKEQTQQQLGWEYERKGMEREEEREVIEQMSRIEAQSQTEPKRTETIERTPAQEQRADVDWMPER